MTAHANILALNEPSSSCSSFRPVPIINALGAPGPDGRRSHLFSSRDHQDAQELFQLISSLMKTEALSVDKEEIRDRGLGEALAGPSQGSGGGVEAGKSVFEGLTANRRSCVECGYTEAVMHFTFDNITLPVPHQVCRKLSFTISLCTGLFF